ncbi:hypothetical protein Scep_025449 [Stephania cephalantha]|uniref:Uncharacterized protein n=1 Tax=Stephania cephalantha TaxID=152367 RepID=A0AAP0EKS8_9MAGN
MGQNLTIFLHIEDVGLFLRVHSPILSLEQYMARGTRTHRHSGWVRNFQHKFRTNATLLSWDFQTPRPPQSPCSYRNPPTLLDEIIFDLL